MRIPFKIIRCSHISLPEKVVWPCETSYPCIFAHARIPEYSNNIRPLYSHVYVKIRSHSDPKVNVCLDSALAGEQEWSRKKSTLDKCDDLWQNFKVKGLSGHQLKERPIKNYVMSAHKNGHLTFKPSWSRGSFLTVWKSLVYNLPHKVATFLMNSVTDTLNTNANLCRCMG